MTPNTLINQLLYLQEPDTLDFETIVEAIHTLPDGRLAAQLSRSYFYPTGGGQEHDTGSLGEAAVLEVFKDETAGRILHVLDRPIPHGPARAHIHRERRLRHMQHHTAQHLLSQCFLRLFEIDSLSANINGYTPSTVDLAADILPRQQLDAAEDLANQIIFENRAVTSRFVTAEELRQLPMRWPPKVSENIRVVEIAGFDWSACGGTHVSATGMIGLVKIVKTERVNDKLRVHFVAGCQALEHYRTLYGVVNALAGQMNTHPQELPAAVARLNDQLKAAQRELDTLRLERLAAEAQRLAQAAEAIGSVRLVAVSLGHRSAAELRALANEFKQMAGYVAVLACHDGQKASLAVACAPASGCNARELLTRLLTPLGGRGGGDAILAQGGGAMPYQALENLLASTAAVLEGKMP